MNVPEGPQVHRQPRMGARRSRRHRDDRHHRSRAGRARRPRVHRAARRRPQARGGRSLRRRRVGEGRVATSMRRSPARSSRSNDDAAGAPETVNADAYAAWLFRIKPADPRRARRWTKLLDRRGATRTSRCMNDRRDSSRRRSRTRGPRRVRRAAHRHDARRPGARCCAVLGYRVARRADRRDRARRRSANRRRSRCPAAMTEAEALAQLRAIAATNRVLKSFIGQGYYGTHTPGVILRNVLENPAWYTAYTPYQPEISQGRLEALVNFQTMVCDLTGMAIANASMLDEGDRRRRGDDALRCASGKSTSRTLLRRRRRVRADARRRAHARGAARHRGRRRPAPRPRRRRTPSRVLLQYPGANGDVRDYRALAAARARARRRSSIVAADLLALTLLAPPGRMGRRRRRRLGAALRRADGLRRPARRLSRDARRVQALAARPPRRRDGRRATAIPRTASRCRRASSTSAARRRRRTSARRRCCSR